MKEEAFRTKVRALYAERFGPEAARLDAPIDGRFHAAVAGAYPELDPVRADELAFHLSDWRADAAFLLAVALEPARFTPDGRAPRRGASPSVRSGVKVELT